MSNEPIQPGGHGGYEREDLGAKSIYGFLLGLAVLGVLVYFSVNGMYWGLEKYSGAHQPRQNPMKQKVESDTRNTNTTKVRGDIQSTFPEPRLETDERDELTESRAREEEHLNSYGWVDKPGGAVYIPVDRAMQLLAERGLPVRSQPPVKAATQKDSVQGKIDQAAKPQ